MLEDLEISETANLNLREWRENYNQLLVYCKKLDAEVKLSKQVVFNLSTENAELLLKMKNIEEARKFEEENECPECAKIRHCKKLGISVKEYEQKKMIEDALFVMSHKSMDKESANIDKESINVDKESTNVDKESTNVDKESTSILDSDTFVIPLEDKDPLAIVTANQVKSMDVEQTTRDNMEDNVINIDNDNLDNLYDSDKDIDDELMNNDAINDPDFVGDIHVNDRDDTPDIHDFQGDLVKDEIDVYLDVDDMGVDTVEEPNAIAGNLAEVDVKLEPGEDLKVDMMKKKRKEIMEEILAAGNHDSMQIKTLKNDKDMTDENHESMEELREKKNKSQTAKSAVSTEKNDKYLVDPSTVTKEQDETALTSESSVSTKSGKGKWVCSLCDKTYTNKQTLHRHIEAVHYLIKNHKCSVCDYSTSRKKNLARHVERIHEKIKKFKCSRCDKIFENHADLISHRANHPKKKRIFKCKNCDKIYNHRTSLENHRIAIHSGITYKCPFCEFVTNYNFKLETHIERHYKKLDDTQPKPKKRQCKRCPEEFYALEDLNKHRKSKHPKLYECKECDKIYKESNSLLDHKMSHHNDGDELICPECTYTTKSRTFMGAHIRRIHRKQK